MDHPVIALVLVVKNLIINGLRAGRNVSAFINGFAGHVGGLVIDVGRLDYVQLLLSITGLIPGLGIASGAASAYISQWRGNYASVVADILGAIPIGGTAVNAIRAGYLGVRAANRFGQVERALLRLGQIAARGGNTVLRFLGVKNGSQVSKWVSTVGQFVLCDVLGLACFTAGTPVLMADGSAKMIEQIVADDVVLARDEHDATAPVVGRRVLQTFVRLAQVLHLHFEGGAVVGTTGEHPFYRRVEAGTAEGQPGEWVAARELAAGEWLLTLEGAWVRVGEVYDTGEWAQVYNCEVEQDHTYFVGGQGGEWVWAHNVKNYKPGDTAPTLPSRVIAQAGQVIIEHYYHGAHDHGPAHLHISDGKDKTRIGANGHPVNLPNDTELTPGMRKLIAKEKSAIRAAVNKIYRWITYQRQIYGGIQNGPG